jgi:hypothetical protein
MSARKTRISNRAVRSLVRNLRNGEATNDGLRLVIREPQAPAKLIALIERIYGFAL